MNNNSIYSGFHAEARILVEEQQTPLLCFYLDRESNEVKVIADSESQRKVKDSEQFEKLEFMLKSALKEKNKLTFYDDCSLGQCNPQEHPMLASSFSYDQLPTEILRTVFRYLGPEDLKNLLLVSQTWKSVADSPLLWTGFGLPTKCLKNKELFQEFLEGSLSSKLQYLQLGKFDFKLDDKYFERFMALNLSSIEITSSIDLSNVSYELLATLVNSCTECSVSDTRNSQKKLTEQLEAILKKMSVETKIKSIKLEHVKLTSIPPDVLSEAFKNLTSIDLDYVEISSDQIQAIFKNLRMDANVQIKIEEGLDDGTWAWTFDVECLDSILDRLTSFSFCGEPLDGQLRRWMEILDKSCKLKFLGLLEIDVRQIPAQLLARVMNKVESLNLNFCEDASPNQSKEIFKGIVKSDSKIKHLELDSINLRLISPELFAKAVNKLESFYHGFCKVSEIQVLEMFRIMSLGTNLKHLGVYSPELGHSLDRMDHIELVDPEILAKAVNNMESIQLDLGASTDLGYGPPSLTLAQLVAILKQLDSKTSLKKIWRYSSRYYRWPYPDNDYEIVYI